MTLRPYAVALRPQAGGCLPRGRSLGHALLGSPTRGPMGCPGGRQGRAHPPIGVPKNANDPAGVTDPHTQASRPRPGRAAGRRTMGLRRQRAAPAGTLGSGGPQRRSSRRRGELARPCGPPDRRSCGLPVRLPHAWRTWGSLDDPEVPVNSAGIPTSVPRSARPALVAPRYKPRSDGSGPGWETLRPQVGLLGS